jgi:DNA-binding PadR family transcriptional regulator
MRHYDDDNEWRFGKTGFMGHEMGRFRGFGLKYWVLTIVSRESSTGAMIMDKIENMSMGRWRPSPGHIYPLLEQMTAEGYLALDNRDGKKYYSVTDKGKSVLEGSWFPWRTMGGLAGISGLEDALRNIETLADYVSDNREKISNDAELRKRVKNIIEKLSLL